MADEERDKQVDQFADELDRLIERFRAEYDLCYASAVGVLTMKAYCLMREAQDRSDE